MLLRYYEAYRHRHRMEMLFCELVARFLGLPQEEELDEVMARLTAHANRSVEEELLVSEEEGDLATAYEELLHLTFNGSSPPHQLLTFGFVKLLAWTPRKIVAELSDILMQDLTERLEIGYVHESQLPKEHVRPCFQQLRE